jgi:uncharacterized protein YrrD
MENKMEFHKNATVLGAGGSELGHLERVVLETESPTLTHLVVSAGGLFNKEHKVVPVGQVTETSPEQIVLSIGAQELETLPPFEEQHVVAIAEEEQDPGATPALPTPAAYGAPIMGTPLPASPADRYKTRTEQNIPEGTVALKAGAKVVTVEGKSLGSVEGVIAEAPRDHVTHLLVASGLISKASRVMPMDWVRAVADDEVQLRLGREDSFEDLETIEGS